jgi:hypothetical protein
LLEDATDKTSFTVSVFCVVVDVDVAVAVVRFSRQLIQVATFSIF